MLGQVQDTSEEMQETLQENSALAARSAREQSAVSVRMNGPVGLLYTRRYIEIDGVITHKRIYNSEHILCIYVSDMRFGTR